MTTRSGFAQGCSPKPELANYGAAVSESRSTGLRPNASSPKVQLRSINSSERTGPESAVARQRYRLAGSQNVALA